jgi:gas vesicle protein
MMNFLTGLGLGFGLGVLFAPMRGEDMREQLAVRAREMADTARNQYEQSRDKAERAISAIREGGEQRTGTQV